MYMVKIVKKGTCVLNNFSWKTRLRAMDVSRW